MTKINNESYASGQPQPAVKADEGAQLNPLQAIADKLLDGREVGGYTLIPVKKLKKNHAVIDAGVRVKINSS